MAELPNRPSGLRWARVRAGPRRRHHHRSHRLRAAGHCLRSRWRRRQAPLHDRRHGAPARAEPGRPCRQRLRRPELERARIGIRNKVVTVTVTGGASGIGKALCERFGQVDVFCSNAGIIARADEDASNGEWQRH